MKLALAILFMAGVSSWALTFAFTWSPSTSEMAGLSQSDYQTNIAFVLCRSTNVTTPLTNWPQYAVWPASSLTNQASLWFTPSVTNDGNSAFYTLQVSNMTSGTVSPFSNLAPWFQAPSSGIIKSIK